MCGNEFSQDEAEQACKECPLAGCDLIRCPYCGYETVPEPGWVAWFKRLFSRRQSANANQH